VEPWDDSSPTEALGPLATGTWRPGQALRAAASALVEATYAVVAPRRPMGKRGPDTESSPVGAAVIPPVSASPCEATRAACRRSDRACRERRPERRRRRGTEGLATSVLASAGVAASRAELLTIGEAHEIDVPRGLEVQAAESDFESGREGVRVAHGVPLAAVLGAKHHREGW
jgi:hypothetical protein